MKLISNIVFIISITLSCYYLYLHLIPFEVSKVLLGLLSIILLIGPFIIEKFSKVKIEKYIKLIYYFFLLIAFILGGLFTLYYRTSFFDLLVHGLFGFLLSIIIGYKLKNNSWESFFLLLSIVLFIGFFWESLEFLGDVFTGSDHQEKITGAEDTMTDLLISLAGSTIYCVFYKLLNKIKK